jgi:hypothetical protein
LTLEVIDGAGNRLKRSFNIFFDDSVPRLDKESLGPNTVFGNDGSVGQSSFQYPMIDGRLTKPKKGVDVTVFTIGQGEREDGRQVSCQDYENYFKKLWGQDTDQIDDDNEDLNDNGDGSFDMSSLANYIFAKQNVKTDSNGRFDDVVIALKAPQFDDLDDKKSSNQARSSKSVNDVCFVMRDKFGNVGVDGVKVEFNGGNTCWRNLDVSMTRSYVTSSEIEGQNSVEGQGSDMELGVVASFGYECEGDVSQVNGFGVNVDRSYGDFGKYFYVKKVKSSRFDEATGEALVYFILGVKPFNRDLDEYPDKVDIGFLMRPSYSIVGQDSTIDTVNTVPFQYQNFHHLNYNYYLQPPKKVS